MVIVMQPAATEDQIQKVIDILTRKGFDAHRSTGATRTVIGAVGGGLGAVVDPHERGELGGEVLVAGAAQPARQRRDLSGQGVRLSGGACVLGRFRAQFRPSKVGREGLPGRVASVVSEVGPEGGKVFVDGEYWNACSEVSVPAGNDAEIVSIDGLTLRVKPATTIEKPA